MTAITFPDGPEQAPLTADTVLRYHLCWKHRDLDGVIALYHPDIQYHDFSRTACSAMPSCATTCAPACPMKPARTSSTVTVSASTAALRSSSTRSRCKG